MKKHIIKNVVFILLLAAVLPVYAIDFNEPRKVLISQYANAVYRDLTVLDTMHLEVDDNDSYGRTRTFFLEIGKRPAYFWNANKYYLQQVQQLNFYDIKVNDESSPLVISSTTVKNGSFIGSNLFFVHATSDGHPAPTISMGGTTPHLYMDNINLFVMNLGVDDNIPEIDIYGRVIKPYSTSDFTEIGYRMHQTYLRDVAFGVGGGADPIPFPSPRMVIQAQNLDTPNEKYRANGTSLTFDLEPAQELGTLHSYYGPWELYNGGVASDDPCPTGTNGQRCFKVNVTGCPECVYSNTPPADLIDKNDEEFKCADSLPNTIGTHDFPSFSNGYCYDYNVVNPKDIMNCGDYDALHNNNQGYYEFKVQEVYAYAGGTAKLTFLDQSPRTRIDPKGGVLVPIIYNTNPDWNSVEINAPTKKYTLHMNGEDIKDVLFIKLGNSGDKYPCYTICNKTTCKGDYIYVRDRYVREIKGSDSELENSWPGESKQDMFLVTYTLGFCPNSSLRDKAEGVSAYKTYEINRDKLNSGYSWLESMDTNNKKVCIKREVRCNMFDSTAQKVKRDYQLFTTDH